MNELQKRRVKTVLKYTWPIYLVSAVAVGFGLRFIFGLTHKMPRHQQLTIFLSGIAKDEDQLSKDILDKYQDRELKSFHSIIANPEEGKSYFEKLTVPGYATADILIIPDSVMKTLNAGYFSLEISPSLINEYFSSLETYSQDEKVYGVTLDKEKAQEYVYLPNETCYLFLNGNSANLGEYTLKDANKEHDTALRIVQEWGKHAVQKKRTKRS